jgi:anti-anti-sigma factor
MQSSILVGLDKKNNFWIKLVGDVRLPWCISLDTYCEKVIKQPGLKKVFIDLTDTDNIDSTTLGVLAKISNYSRKFRDNLPILISINDDIDRLIISTGLMSIFEIKKDFNINPDLFDNLPIVSSSDEEIKKSVIDAHEKLMELTKDNQLKFKSLVDYLNESS